MELKMKHVGLQNLIKNMKASINIGSKFNKKSNKSRWKSYQKSIKNLSKINENEVHGGILGWLWGYLGSCWLKVMSFGRILVWFFHFFAPRWLQDAFKMGSWAVLGSKLVLKMGQNRSQERSETLSIRWSIWRLIFEAIWSEFGSILTSKNLPKWSQVGCKIDPSLVLIWELFLKGFRYHFLLNFVHNIT